MSASTSPPSSLETNPPPFPAFRSPQQQHQQQQVPVTVSSDNFEQPVYSDSDQQMLLFELMYENQVNQREMMISKYVHLAHQADAIKSWLPSLSQQESVSYPTAVAATFASTPAVAQQQQQQSALLSSVPVNVPWSPSRVSTSPSTPYSSAPLTPKTIFTSAPTSNPPPLLLSTSLTSHSDTLLSKSTATSTETLFATTNDAGAGFGTNNSVNNTGIDNRHGHLGNNSNNANNFDINNNSNSYLSTNNNNNNSNNPSFGNNVNSYNNLYDKNNNFVHSNNNNNNNLLHTTSVSHLVQQQPQPQPQHQQHHHQHQPLHNFSHFSNFGLTIKTITTYSELCLSLRSYLEGLNQFKTCLKTSSNFLTSYNRIFEMMIQAETELGFDTQPGSELDWIRITDFEIDLILKVIQDHKNCCKPVVMVADNSHRDWNTTVAGNDGIALGTSLLSTTLIPGVGFGSIIDIDPFVGAPGIISTTNNNGTGLGGVYDDGMGPTFGGGEFMDGVSGIVNGARDIGSYFTSVPLTTDGSFAPLPLNPLWNTSSDALMMASNSLLSTTTYDQNNPFPPFDYSFLDQFALCSSSTSAINNNNNNNNNSNDDDGLDENNEQDYSTLYNEINTFFNLDALTVGDRDPDMLLIDTEELGQNLQELLDSFNFLPPRQILPVQPPELGSELSDQNLVQSSELEQQTTDQQQQETENVAVQDSLKSPSPNGSLSLVQYSDSDVLLTISEDVDNIQNSGQDSLYSSRASSPQTGTVIPPTTASEVDRHDDTIILQSKEGQETEVGSDADGEGDHEQVEEGVDSDVEAPQSISCASEEELDPVKQQQEHKVRTKIEEEQEQSPLVVTKTEEGNQQQEQRQKKEEEEEEQDNKKRFACSSGTDMTTIVKRAESDSIRDSPVKTPERLTFIGSACHSPPLVESKVRHDPLVNAEDPMNTPVSSNTRSRSATNNKKSNDLIDNININNPILPKKQQYQEDGERQDVKATPPISGGPIGCNISSAAMDDFGNLNDATPALIIESTIDTNTVCASSDMGMNNATPMEGIELDEPQDVSDLKKNLSIATITPKKTALGKRKSGGAKRIDSPKRRVKSPVVTSPEEYRSVVEEFTPSGFDSVLSTPPPAADDRPVKETQSPLSPSAATLQKRYQSTGPDTESGFGNEATSLRRSSRRLCRAGKW